MKAGLFAAKVVSFFAATGSHVPETYVVGYKSELSAAHWTSLWTSLAATDWLSFTNATTNVPQHFFRIRSVE